MIFNTIYYHQKQHKNSRKMYKNDCSKNQIIIRESAQKQLKIKNQEKIHEFWISINVFLESNQ